MLILPYLKSCSEKLLAKSSKIGCECSSTNCSRQIWLINGTLFACVQKQSCTDTNVNPALSQFKAVNIICDESNECTKFGANEVRCFDDRFGGLAVYG